jgi:hypothetical protein
MKMKRLLVGSSVLALAVMAGTASHLVEASDHDDGEMDLKGRALNLTDHYAFRSAAGTELSLIMYVNPRSLPGRQYFLSTDARYEFHISRVATKATAPTNADDYVVRIEAGAPTAAGVQPLTLTILAAGVVVGTHTGTSTGFAASKANTGTLGNTAAAIGAFTNVKYFVGQRADSFYFDVNRYFQVRAFLAEVFFGNAGNPNLAAATTLPPNCRGDALLALGAELTPDADTINLFNPPSCAPDFTKNLNVTSIAVNIPISALGGGTLFDTWSTISIKEVN